MTKVYIIHENGIWVEPLRKALRALGTGDSESGRILVRLLGQSVPLDRLRQLIALHDRITPRAAMLLVEGLRAGIPASVVRPASGIASPFGGIAHADRREVGAPRQTGSGTNPLATGRRDVG